MTFGKLKRCFTYVTLFKDGFRHPFPFVRHQHDTWFLLLSGSCDVLVIFWVYGQGFSQKGVQPSYGWLFLEEITRKIHLISYNFMGKHAFSMASFQCLAKECVWEMLQLKVHPALLLCHTKQNKTDVLYMFNSALFCLCHCIVALFYIVYLAS